MSSAPVRAPGSWAVARVVEGHAVWFARNWRAMAVTSLLQPLLALVSFGVLFGRLAADGPGLDGLTGGVAYIVYLTPALLCATALLSAVTETTFPVFAGFQWQKNYEAITATPVTPQQLSTGLLLWVGIRGLLGGTVFLAVAACFGGVQTWGIVVSLLVSVLTGLAFAAPIAAFSASLKKEGSAFNVLFRFVVVPMTLFAGTYFPIDRLPGWAEAVAVVTPLWHGTQLARDAALGTWEPGPSLLHLGYLLLWAGVGFALAAWRFRVRLTK